MLCYRLLSCFALSCFQIGLSFLRCFIMKILIHLAGLLSSVTACLGLTFKILHWPGADELLIYGFIVFTLVFIPIHAYSKWRTEKYTNRIEKLKLLVGFACSLLTGISVLFKILHLTGADALFITGALLFITGFLPVLFYAMYMKPAS